MPPRTEASPVTVFTVSIRCRGGRASDAHAVVAAGRRINVVDVPLDGLRAAARTAGGTLNDGFLAGITGGLRRYHHHHGADVSDLRVAMPVSLRTDDHAAGGNHLASNVPGVPVPMYLVGAEVRGFSPFGPTLGSSVNITLMSYRDTAHVGVNSDAAAIADAAVFLDCLVDGFDEVLDLQPG